VVSNFIIQALSNPGPDRLWGREQTARFCYVDDLVDGLVRLMEVRRFHGSVNLGNPGRVHVYCSGADVIRMTSSRSKGRLQTLPSDDPLQRKPDIALARQTLGLGAARASEQGLSRTIALLREEAPRPRLAP